MKWHRIKSLEPENAKEFRACVPQEIGSGAILVRLRENRWEFVLINSFPQKNENKTVWGGF